MINNILKIVQASMPNQSTFWKNDFSKNIFLHMFYNGVRRLQVLAKVDRTSIKINQKSMLEKVMKNGAQIIKNDTKIVLKSIQNHSQIAPKIDAKFVVQKSSLGAPKGRQGDFEPPTRRSFWARGVPIQ